MKGFRTFAGAALLILTGCAGPGLFAGEPMGKQLERALEEIKKDCIERGLPPFGENRPGRFETSCLMFTLKPWEPGDTPESAFAHSIKLPPPHDKPKDVYKAGMSSEEYFKVLCEAEAGVWVFRRVEGVRGILKHRPLAKQKIGYSPLAFYTLEKGEHNDSGPQEKLVQPFLGTYQFLEMPNSNGIEGKEGATFTKYIRGMPERSTRTILSSKDGLLQRIPYIVEKTEVSAPVANIAYTARGIAREQDRTHAIEGSELIIFQLKPFEVLAFRRTFYSHYFDKSNKLLREPSGAACPNDPIGPYQFIQSVAVSN